MHQKLDVFCRYGKIYILYAFTNGDCYEYFGVNANVFKKFINADKQVRFAKRFIYDAYLYRKSKKGISEE